jgi:hypothetical protein
VSPPTPHPAPPLLKKVLTHMVDTTTHKFLTRRRTPERSEFLSDVVTTALEGGIGYWSEASVYKWWSPTLDGGTAEHHDGLGNAYAVIDEVGDGDRDRVEHLINLDVVATGIRRIVAGDVVHEDMTKTIREADRDNDASLLDAADCDAIVQVGLLAEVRYG